LSRDSNILILGVGNDILRDDGVGPVICRMLEEEFSSSRVRFDTINLGGLEVFEFIKEYSRVIIIDAIKTAKGKAGDVYYLTPSDFRETCHLSSFHDISFLTALKFGQEIGYDMPEVEIIAIEIVEDMEFGTEFSPELKSRFQDVYSEIRSFLLPVISIKNKAPGRESVYNNLSH
jgi:hydrogenase maturation protease